MIYLSCFSVSVGLAYWANRIKKKELFYLFSALSILIPVLLAGLRDYSIGIDVQNYLKMDRFWAGAMRKDSLGAYMDYYNRLGYCEYLFALFVGLIAKLTGEYRVFLFLSHAIIVTGVYVGAFRMKHRARPEFILLLFYLLYFNNSLNIIRQYMAMSIIFAFFSDIEKRKFVRYSVVVLISSLIHTTALISFAPLFVYLILYPKKSISEPSLKIKICTYSCIPIGVICFLPLVKLLMKIGILGEKYSFYFSGEFGEINKTRFALLALEILFICLCYKKMKSQFTCVDFYVTFSILFVALHILGLLLIYGQRIPTYFCFINIISLSMLASCQETKKLRILGYGVIICFALYYWYHTYVLGLSSGTFPYLFGV